MIELRHLKKQYDQATPLMDVSTNINKGDAIAVIGPSGTGKSTLLRCMNLLEKPTAGSIIVDGEDITNPKCNVNKVRLKIGMVFQSFNLYEHLTVVENCMLAQTKILKRSRKEAYDKAMELLKSVGMENQALKYPNQLSGGQKQRAAIARTLSTDPEIILFDEPTSALDPLTVGEVEEIIIKLSREGRTMMIVTHSMDFARKVSNRVFYMDQGGIYEDGTPEQIFDNPQKDLTRRFINRLSTLDMIITPENHNLNVEIGRVHSFCEGKGFDAQRIINACHVYEETFNVVYNFYLPGDKTIHFVFEYKAADDTLTCSVVPYSEPEWPKREAEMTSSPEYKLIAHFVKSYREETTTEGAGMKYVYIL